jgi:hypothetical protein
VNPARKFLIRINEVEEWPEAPPRSVTAYAYAAELTVQALAQRISHWLKAEVITDDAVFTPESSRLPPYPPVPSETL